MISRENNKYLNAGNRELQKNNDILHKMYDEELIIKNILNQTPEEIDRALNPLPKTNKIVKDPNIVNSSSKDITYVETCINYLQYKVDSYKDTMVSEDKIKKILLKLK